MYKIYLSLLIALVLSPSLRGQSPALYFNPQLYQSTALQPARFQKSRFTLAIPSVASQFWNSAFSISDILVPDGDSTKLDVDKVLGQMRDRNFIRVLARVEPLTFALTLDRWQLMGGVGATGFSLMDYPKSTVEVAWRGNQQFVGQSINLAPLGSVVGYTDAWLGAAFKVGENIRLGFKAHVLWGMVNMQADKGTFLMTTLEDNYQLQFDQDYVIRTSGINFEDSSEVSVDPFANTPGYALDFGVEWDILENLTVSASATNLGQLSWTAGVLNYNFKGRDVFEGAYLEGTDIDAIDFDALLDSFLTELEPEQSFESFKTPLPARFILAGEYRFEKGFAAGLVLAGEHYQGDFFPTVAIAGRKSFGEIFHLGLTYAYKYNRWDNVGLTADLHLGPFGFYAMSDNLLGMINYRNARTFNFLIGFNWYFGRRHFDQAAEPGEEYVPPGFENGFLDQGKGDG